MNPNINGPIVKYLNYIQNDDDALNVSIFYMMWESNLKKKPPVGKE